MSGKTHGLLFICMLIFHYQPITAQDASTLQTQDGNFGFGILERIPDLWNGPVSSTTPAGSFQQWHVDFRPVSAGQVSQYSTLDAQTLNSISFFIVKYGNEQKVALRTEGVFQNKGCVTYEVMDTANEGKGYHRFADFQAGDKRAYTENVHPGQYDLYSFNDVNQDKMHSSGDYMSSNTSNRIVLPPDGSVTVNTRIDFVIP